MYLPRVDFIGPDIVPATSNEAIGAAEVFAAEALNIVPFEADAWHVSSVSAKYEAQLHRLVTLFE